MLVKVIKVSLQILILQTW